MKPHVCRNEMTCLERTQTLQVSPSPSPLLSQPLPSFDSSFLSPSAALRHKGPHPSHQIHAKHEMHQRSRNQRPLASHSQSPQGGGGEVISWGALLSTSLPNPPTLDAPCDVFPDENGRAGVSEREAFFSSSLLSSHKSGDPSIRRQGGADEVFMYRYDDGAARSHSFSRALHVPSTCSTDRTSVPSPRPSLPQGSGSARGGRELGQGGAHESLSMLRAPRVRGFA